MLHFDFKAIITSSGYHLYKETTWLDTKVNGKVKIETNQSLISISSYACRVKAEHKYFDGRKFVGQVPREISKYNYFFIKRVGGRIIGYMKSLSNKPLPFLSGGLKVPLLLTLSCLQEWFWIKMKDFINEFYIYTFTGIIHNNGSLDQSGIEIDLDLTGKKKL